MITGPSILNFMDVTPTKTKKTSKKKVVKSKLFNTVKTENTERDMLMNFIKVGTDIQMINTTLSKQFMSEFAFERKTVLEIDGYKITFERYTPEVGYMRHPSYYFRKHKLTIKKKTENKWLLKVDQDGHIINFVLENY